MPQNSVLMPAVATRSATRASEILCIPLAPLWRKRKRGPNTVARPVSLRPAEERGGRRFRSLSYLRWRLMSCSEEYPRMSLCFEVCRDSFMVRRLRVIAVIRRQ